MVIPLTSGTRTSAMNYFGLIWTICRFQDVHWIGPFFFQKPIQYSQNRNYFQTPPPSFSYPSCHSKNNLFALHHNPTNYQYPATGSTYILPHDPSLFHQFRQTKNTRLPVRKITRLKEKLPFLGGVIVLNLFGHMRRFTVNQNHISHHQLALFFGKHRQTVILLLLHKIFVKKHNKICLMYRYHEYIF